MSKRKYTKEILEEAVKNSLSVADVIRKLDLKQTGGNHNHVKNMIIQFNLDVSHFLRSRANSGKNHVPEKLKPEQILVDNRLNGRRDACHRLRRALIESGIEHKCKVCEQLPLWNGKYLQLQIDHINGNGTDNRIENLRFICGNCHLQTDTFGVRNAKFYIEKEKVDVKSSEELQIKEERIADPNWRTNPRPNKRKVERPSKEELEKMLWEIPTSQLADQFGVSDKAIEKWAKSYNITKPPPGYWAKKKANKL